MTPPRKFRLPDVGVWGRIWGAVERLPGYDRPDRKE